MEPDDLEELYKTQKYDAYEKKKAFEKAIQELRDSTDKYGSWKDTLKDQFPDYYQKLKDGLEEEPFEEEEEEVDEDLELVEFYAKLLVEKIGRFPILGKAGLSFDHEVERVDETDMYDVYINIGNNISGVSIDFAVDTVKELKQLEDDKNNVSITLNDDIVVRVRVNVDDLRELDPANKAASKFKL